jgi:hypothetical protein
VRILLNRAKTFLFFFSLLIISVRADSIILTDVYKKWQNSQEKSTVFDFGSRQKTKSLFLHFGQRPHDQSNIEVLSAKLLGKTLKISIQFTKKIYAVTDLLPVDPTDDTALIRLVNLANLLAETDYKVELYGSDKILTADGEDVTPSSQRLPPRLFGKFEILSEQNWLSSMRQQLEIGYQPNPQFKKFLKKKIPTLSLSAKNYPALIKELKKITTSHGFDFVFLAQQQHSHKDMVILVENGRYYSQTQDFNLSFRNITFHECLLRIAAKAGLCYKIGLKGIVLASRNAFKISQTLAGKKKLKLPGLSIDTVNKRLTVEAKICTSSGVLEYLMCLPNSFEHEAIFVTNVKPELLHMGLLLIGTEALPFDGGYEAMQQIENNKSRLSIVVEWLEDGNAKKADLNTLLIDRSQTASKTSAQDSWFFAGSYFTKENTYAANLHMSIISLQQHPASVIHYGKQAEDPYSSEHSGFEVNEKLCPPYGSNVRLIFSTHKTLTHPQISPLK